MKNEKIQVLLIMFISMIILYCSVKVADHLITAPEPKSCTEDADIFKFSPSKVVKSYSIEDTVDVVSYLEIDIHSQIITLNDSLSYKAKGFEEYKDHILYVIDAFGVSVIFFHTNTGSIQIDSVNGVKTYYLP
jgi:hypothetical protein